MEKLKLLKRRYNSVCNVHMRLAERLCMLKKLDPYDDFYCPVRDSAIQSFEFTIDTFWKMVKEYLACKHGIVVENASPRKIFLEAAAVGVLSKDDLPAFLRMVDDRNITSHTYQEILAREIAERLPEYSCLLEKTLQRLIL